MSYDGYKIINYQEFLDSGLPSKELQFVLKGIGLKTILVTKGIHVGLVHDGVFLPVYLNGRNPFFFENYAVYLDDNEDIWLGVKKE